MSQLHKRLTNEAVSAVFSQYVLGTINRDSALAQLDIGRSQFFDLLKAYRSDPAAFSVLYTRASPSRITVHDEEKIMQELRHDQRLVEHTAIPVDQLDATALLDRNLI